MQETWVWSLEDEITTHSSVLAWEISWIGEPGSLQSMGQPRVTHNWSNLVCTHNNGTFLQGALVFAWQGYCHFKSKDYIKTHDLACDLLLGVLFQWVSPWGVPLGHFSSLWRQSLVWCWILPKNWAFFLKHLITNVSFSGKIKMHLGQKKLLLTNFCTK